ncbi:uncharacterized protein LOC131649936 [Vicia villosa]|uniref:uncharacterized protein LOC131649936 n=1 Tax=Vicia villosa TaxID=3911 RepID=UPI00273ACFA2|nr:uncharacterized protein LOC131649936 [Vicia villosa]
MGKSFERLLLGFTTDGMLCDDIHVVVPTPHVSVFNDKCLLGHTYTVSNFKVVPYVLAFKASRHKYMSCEINIFVSDVIRMVDSIGYAHTESGAKKQQISMVLRDHRFNKDKVDALVPTVVLLQYAKVKEEGYFISYNSKNSQLTPVQKLLPKAVVLPIAEITQLKDITFCVTVATTKLLVASPFGWYYRACHMCQSIARGDKPPFECEAGNETMAEVIRYKFEIEVTHGGKSCNFVFWNRECKMILGLSASQLRNTMIKDGITDPLDFPLAVDQLLKLEMAVKIKESVDEAKTDVHEDRELDLEITFEHKPNIVTPAGKRHFPSASSESTNLEGLYDGELSSNKLKKIIKLEKNG